MRCLIVDPSATMRRLVGHTLRSLGCDDVAEAADAARALQACGERVPDLIVTEWNLPGTSGIDLAVQLRGTQATSQIPIVLITARNRKEDVLKAAQAKVNAYLLRPFTQEGLRERLQAFVPDEGPPRAELPKAA